MNKGFSLVELSIVLVILGLLTGGILAGQSLIRAAELRAVSSEHSRYITAAQTFRDKYFALPGDFNRAEDFWDPMTNCDAASPSGSGTETCNGDGNGDIDLAGALSQTGEIFGFWQHLANAGLIEGTYDGIAGSGGTNDAELGDNAPRSKLTNAGWSVRNVANGTVVFYEYDYENALIFGEDSTNGDTTSAALTPEEAWNIDTKMDDGQPAYGRVLAVNWDDECSAADDGGSADDDYEASYVLTDTSAQCALIFKKAF